MLFFWVFRFGSSLVFLTQQKTVIMQSKNQNGMTILEVIISIVILTIVISSFSTMFAFGRNFIDMKGEERIALCLARQKIEEFKAKFFDDLIIEEITNTPPVTADGTPMNGLDGTPDYTYLQRMTKVVYVEDGNYNNEETGTSESLLNSKRITVVVSSTKDPKSFDDVILWEVITR